MTRSRIIASLAALGLIVGLLLWGPAACRSFFTNRTELKVEKERGKATLDTMDALNNKAAEVAANSAATEVAVKGGIDAIDQAEAGNSNDAADRAACGLRSYRNSDRCARLRQADLARAAEARRAR